MWDAEGCLGETDSDQITGLAQWGFVGGYPVWLFGVLSEVEEFQVLFADRIHAHLRNQGLLTPTANKDRVDGVASVIEDAMVAESARWGDGSAGIKRPATLRGYEAMNMSRKAANGMTTSGMVAQRASSPRYWPVRAAILTSAPHTSRLPLLPTRV